MNVTDVWITMADGVRLAATLYLPGRRRSVRRAPRGAAVPQGRPHGVVPRLVRPVRRRGRVRGAAGSTCAAPARRAGRRPTSTRTPNDADLRAVIGWLATQPWSSGRVGMFGTSYSGFNSLHMAAEGVPELGAVVAMYATDDRYTDDVHYHGGVLRAIDLIDYVLYMVPMNALPPVPALWGDGWEDEWRRRVDESPAWMLDWLREQADSPMWRRGSIRLGPGDQGYERLTCPTMLIAGWADGYRNNTFRTIERLRVPWRLLAGPWSHKDPARARPGPEHRRRPRDHRLLRRAPPRRAAVGRRCRRRCSCAGPTPSRTRPGACTTASGATSSAWPPPGLRWVEYTPVDRRHRQRSSTDDARGARRRRRGGVDLVRRWAAVGPATRPARRRRSVVDVRLADRRAGRGARQPIAVAAGQVVGSGRPPRGAVVRRVPRRHVGADHARDPEPEPRRLLAGRPGR